MDEPFFCICVGQHVEIKGGYQITVDNGGGAPVIYQHDNILQQQQHPGLAFRVMHDGMLVLSVATLRQGTVVQLFPGTELSHPVVVGPHLPASSHSHIHPC